MGKGSPVWKYFTSVEGDHGAFKCNICSKDVKAKDSSTTNLRAHLKKHHPIEFAALNPSPRPPSTGTSRSAASGDVAAASSLPSSSMTSAGAGSKPSLTIIDAFNRGIKYQRSDRTWQKLTDAVTFCIAKDAMPMSTVEKPGFRHLLETFDIRYTPPSATSMSKTYIPKLYDVTREKVLEQLRRADYFAATADMWSSYGMTPYLGYAVHFIDPS